MTTYATTNDYYDATGLPASTDIAELRRLGGVLIEASERVTFSARFGRYATNSNGTPRAQRVIDGFKRATIAEARDLEENGGSDADDYDSVSMGGVTLSKSVRTSSEAKAPDDGVRTASARMILTNLGLFSPAVRTR